jgi:2-methylcitrate dehydratase PrpD
MIRRINFYVDPEAEAAGFDKMTSLIKIHLKDRRILSGRADFAKGSPADPMSFDETARKFAGCAEYAGWQRLDIDAIIEYVKKLDGQSDISKLSSLLTGKKA